MLIGILFPTLAVTARRLHRHATRHTSGLDSPGQAPDAARREAPALANPGPR